MSILNSRGRAARPAGALQTKPAPETGLDTGAETSDGEADQPMARERRPYKADPWWSHAAYGLAMVVLGLPFFLPGISRQGLFVGYVIAATTALVGLMLWGAAQESLERWRSWRRGRAPGRL